MTDRIVYHDVKPGIACPDGISAAWIAAKVYPDAELLGWTYQSESLPKAENGDTLIIVDFSFPGDVIEQWIREGVRVTVIDHHKTAKEALDRFYSESFQDALNASAHDEWNVLFDMKKCGATLAWEYFFPGKPQPAFLAYVEDRDLWNHALPFTEEIHEATAALRRSFALFDVLEQMSQEELIKFLAPLGEKLLKPKREKIKEIASRWDWKWLRKYHPLSRALEFEYEIPVVVLNEDGSEDRLTSDVCSYLYKSLPQAPFVACITSDGSWNLRSDKNGNDTDVGAIAKALGGGGHKNASGWTPKQ